MHRGEKETLCAGLSDEQVRRLLINELMAIKSWMVGALIAIGMIIWMILQKRKEAAIAFSQGLPESSLRYRLAQKWHHFAVLLLLK